MINRIVAWSGRHPFRVLFFASISAVLSYFAQRSLSRDVLPDLSDPQVVLVAEWMGHPALEVAHEVTEVLTNELKGVPGSTAIRGQSMTGMAYLDVIFSKADSVAQGRAEISARVEKLRARLPATVRIQVGPEASSTGWVFEYALMPPPKKKGGMPMGARRPELTPNSLYGLRKFQDEVLRPQLAAIPGVAEVASLGGDTKELLIETTADQLRGAGLAFSDVVGSVKEVLKAPNATLAQVAAAPLAAKRGDGKPAQVSQVATVQAAPKMASGMADVDGNQSIVAGVVIAKRGADVEGLLSKVREVIERERKNLPSDVQLGVLYDRSEFGERVEKTLYRALLEEVAVVALIVLVFLLHLRSALIPFLTLPLIVLLTFASMRLLGVPATIMSLGGIAIALGMAVDADLVALEACHRRIEQNRDGSTEGKRSALISAAESFAPAILTSLVIAALAFIPVFAFGGETGRLLRPLAISKTLVIAAAALVTLTVAPALRDRLLGSKVVSELSNPITRTLVKLYRPFVHFALSRPVFTLLTAGLAAISCLPIISILGGEFLPRIDEGSLLYMPTTAAGVSPDDANSDLAKQDAALAESPEVALVFGKTGRAETATDPAPFSMNETTIRLKPRDAWPKVAHHRWYSGWAPAPVKRVLGSIWPEESPSTTAELVESLDRKIRFAGWSNAWTAPIRARLDMMSTGVRTPVGVRIVASDPGRLDTVGAAVQSALLAVPGTKSAVYESLGGETRVQFEPDAEAMARYKVDPQLVQSTADFLISGGEVGQINLPEEPPAAKKKAASSSKGHDHAGHDHGGHDHEGQEQAKPEAEADKAYYATETTPVDPVVPAAPAEAPAEHEHHHGVHPIVPASVRISFAAVWHPKPLDQLLRDVTVRGGDGEGQPVPLALLGHPKFVSTPAMLRAEHGSPVGYVYITLDEHTNVADYVQAAREHLAQNSAMLQLRADERLEWTGQYELMMAGQARLKWIAPIVLVSMFLLLLWQFRSIAEALIVLAAVPFALVGSVWTLYLLDYKLSAPVWVGLLSVVGLAMQTGVVMVVYIDDAFHKRLREGRIRTRGDIIEAHAEGTVLRLRPKIMTICTMAAALLPLMWAQGAGSEVMKRVAAPMLGGLLTSAFLTLEVIPVLYTLWRTWQLNHAERTQTSLEGVVGIPPAWAARATAATAQPSEAAE